MGGAARTRGEKSNASPPSLFNLAARPLLALDGPHTRAWPRSSAPRPWPAPSRRPGVDDKEREGALPLAQRKPAAFSLSSRAASRFCLWPRPRPSWPRPQPGPARGPGRSVLRTGGPRTAAAIEAAPLRARNHLHHFLFLPTSIPLDGEGKARRSGPWTASLCVGGFCHRWVAIAAALRSPCSTRYGRETHLSPFPVPMGWRESDGMRRRRLPHAPSFLSSLIF